MRKFNLLAIFAFVLSFGFFTSCDPVEAVGPEINFTDAGGVANGGTVAVADSFSIGYSIVAGDEKLETLEVRYNNVTVATVDLDGQLTVAGTVKVAAATEGPATFTFIAEDKGALKATKDFSVTAESATELTVVGDQTMGGQSNPNDGSYYSFADNTVYKQADASTAANQGKIDFVYYYGSTNKASIVAPADVTVGGGTGNLSLCEGWATKNSTKFMKDNSIDFAAATEGDIASITPTETKVTNLAVNDVIVYLTAAGDKGIFKVTALTVDGSGSIAISIKVK